MNIQQKRMARALELAAQCQGEHQVDDPEEGPCVFYCVRPMGHRDEDGKIDDHRDCKGRTWKPFPLFPMMSGPRGPRVHDRKRR